MSGCGNAGCPCGSACQCNSGCSCGDKRIMDVDFNFAIEGDCNDCKCGANCTCTGCTCNN